MVDIQSNAVVDTESSLIEQLAPFCNVSAGYLAAKRTVDIVVSALGLITLLPVFILVAIIIRLDSRGPVLFIQERCGYLGKAFKMYKFRSMCEDAEQHLELLRDRNEAAGCMFKIRKDPRVTRVGRFIRKTSIDELPQLINVLKGDMSLVGPRPPIVREVVKYNSWHNLRLSVRPGLTGLWQVSGRSSLGFDDMVRLDLQYIRERSFLLDVKIILKTIPLLLGDGSAY